MPEFTHLHVHSDYSFLDGGATVSGLAKFAAELGMKSLALTDHGNMCGLIEFRKACEKAGVKPILGSEIYVVPHDMREKKSVGGKDYSHLVLLAENEVGYRNLTKIVSKAYTQGFYRKPRADYATLREHHDGLIALTACLGGEVPQAIMRAQPEAADCVVDTYKSIFGAENLYLEVQNHEASECGAQELKVAGPMFELGKKHGVKCVLTNDSHYLKREDFHAHNVLLCINTKKLITDQNRMEYGPDFYLKSPEEMAGLFPEMPELLTHSMEIAERCALPPNKQGQYFLPSFACPDGMTEPQYLEHLCRVGLRKRYGDPLPEKVEERFVFELGVITKMGFASYFLITQDFVNWAKGQAIPVGPGRGSAAGSIVAYALGITGVDPLAYNLLFERFLNPDRVSMPDIDIDFCQERRGEVIDYVRRKYGSECVCQIGTFGKLLSRSVLKDVGRVLNVPLEVVNGITKKIEVRQGKVPPIAEILEENTELRQQYEDDAEIHTLWETAKTLEGLTRGTGVHAAGVVIAPSSVDNYVPLMLQKEGDDGEPVIATQYTMGEIEQQGLLKMDFLGLRNLTIIDHALKHIREDTGEQIDLEKLPLDDAATYDMLKKGSGFGVFQLESDGMCRLLRSIQPSTFEDISAVLAIYRPGPLGANVHVDFARRKSGEDALLMPGEKGERLSVGGIVTTRDRAIASPEAVERLKLILSDTYGLLIYQEQAMLMSRRLAGFTPGMADKLRKAIGKKDEKGMAELKPKFIEGCEKEGFGTELGTHLWNLMEGFGAYGFNKAHTVAYAVIAFQTAWLKAHYPAQYGAALISSQIGYNEGVVACVKGVREMGMEVVPPDINRSKASFSTSGNQILFGLAGIKGSSTRGVQAILEARQREKGKFLGFMHFLESIDHSEVNRPTLESLIKCGAFDSLNLKRPALLASLEKCMRAAARTAEDKLRGQSNLFGAPASPTRDSEFKRDLATLGDTPDWSDAEKQRAEKEVFGFFLSSSPLDQHAETLKTYRSHTHAELKETHPRQAVVIGGMIQGLKTRVVRKEGSRTAGREYATFTLVDDDGAVDVTTYPDQYDQVRERLADDRVVLVKGNMDPGSEPEALRVTASDIILVEDAATKLKPMSNDPAAEHLLAFCTVPPSRLNTVPQRHKIKMAGRAGAIREIMTKKGDPMFGFPLSNRQGTVDVMCGPRTYQKLKGKVEEDSLYVVTGEVTQGERGATLWMEDVMTFEKARRSMTSAVCLKLDATEVTKSTLEAVRKIVERHRGRLPMFLRLELPELESDPELLPLPANFAVSPTDEMLKELAEAVGKDRLELQANTR